MPSDISCLTSLIPSVREQARGRLWWAEAKRGGGVGETCDGLLQRVRGEVDELRRLLKDGERSRIAHMPLQFGMGLYQCRMRGR